MPAPRNNKNAARANHQRVAVSFSGALLDALYEHLQCSGEIIEEDPEKVRDLVYRFVREGLGRSRDEEAIII
jgi:hypothetical protein